MKKPVVPTIKLPPNQVPLSIPDPLGLNSSGIGSSPAWMRYLGIK